MLLPLFNDDDGVVVDGVVAAPCDFDSVDVADEADEVVFVVISSHEQANQSKTRGTKS